METGKTDRTGGASGTPSADKIAMTPQRRGGSGILGVLKGESVSRCFVTLQPCAINTQTTFAESEPPDSQCDGE